MRKKFYIALIPFLLMAFTVHSQDSVRTRNDKPGTPQSLRTPDQSPQSHVDVNTSTVPNQILIQGAPESNKVNNASGQTIVTDQNTTGKQVPTSPITIVNKASSHTDSTVTNSGAIQNGISNTSNPIRNK